MARAVDRPAARNRHQPRFGIRWAAALRPVCERGCKRVGQRVLGRGDVARAHRQQRDELAVAAASNRLGNLMRGNFSAALAAGRTHAADGASYGAVQTGRTSMRPWAAPGQRAAHAIAASTCQPPVTTFTADVKLGGLVTATLGG